MIKKYNPNKNVLEAAYERLEYIFDEFDNVYLSFSSGKDSGLTLQLANHIAMKKGKKFDVLYIDMEAMYKSSIKYVKRLKELPAINQFYWVCLPINLTNGVSQIQPFWTCWDFDVKSKWVRNIPKESINEKNYLEYGWDWFHKHDEFEDLIIDFGKWYNEKHGGNTACIVAIRSQESLNRFATITSEVKARYKDIPWTTHVLATKRNVFNCYPIYDWETKDIWKATFSLDLDYNEYYEQMYKAGISIHDARICQPYGYDQRNSLKNIHQIEPDTWAKTLVRVKGVNFGNIYAKTQAIGYNKVDKPDNMTWEQYTIFLLETLMKENPDLAYHYIEKFKKFIEYWEKEHGVTYIPDEADKKLEAKREAPSWRRMAKVLMTNDVWCKKLSFGQSKRDSEKLSKLVTKWADLI
jgi:predicted phosphoadenosine phosphosulfate sulfurtransferase